MTLRDALRQAARALASRGIEEPHLEAQLLLGHALGLGRVQLLLRPDEELSLKARWALEGLLERRLGGEPSAYILGRQEFFGLEFYVDRRALIPRPETELLVEAALGWLEAKDFSLVADVGTGCGAIAIALARARPNLQVYAIDISPQALEIAEENARRHGVARQVHLYLGDLLEPLSQPIPLILANLPYIAEADYPHLPREIQGFEPSVALRGGPDGLVPLRRLLAQAPGKLAPGGCLWAEIGWGQGSAALESARAHFPQASLHLLPDLAQLERVLRVQT